MAEPVLMQPIAYICSPFATKFGVPRQSGLVPELEAEIVFEPAYRSPDALRGIEDFDYLWLLWHFSAARQESWSPTVRPPRLGGNTRMGVFATRSPYRPNAIGLSCVRLVSVDWDAEDGPALTVAGADLLDGSPIFDIKPYLPYADAHPEAAGGFAPVETPRLKVDFPEELLNRLPEDKREAALELLAQDPRPGYQHEPGRAYGMAFAGHDIKFTVTDDVLTVTDVLELK